MNRPDFTLDKIKFGTGKKKAGKSHQAVSRWQGHAS